MKGVHLATIIIRIITHVMYAIKIVKNAMDQEVANAYHVRIT